MLGTHNSHSTIGTGTMRIATVSSQHFLAVERATCCPCHTQGCWHRSYDMIERMWQSVASDIRESAGSTVADCACSAYHRDLVGMWSSTHTRRVWAHACPQDRCSPTVGGVSPVGRSELPRLLPLWLSVSYTERLGWRSEAAEWQPRCASGSGTTLEHRLAEA